MDDRERRVEVTGLRVELDRSRHEERQGILTEVRRYAKDWAARTHGGTWELVRVESVHGRRVALALRRVETS